MGLLYYSGLSPSEANAAGKTRLTCRPWSRGFGGRAPVVCTCRRTQDVQGLNPEHTIVVLGVVVGDTLNRSSQYLTIRWCGSTFHNAATPDGAPSSAPGLP
jgi:hypothetical protein